MPNASMTLKISLRFRESNLMMKIRSSSKRSAAGAVPMVWQEEIIETGLFEELNGPNRPAGCGEGHSSKSGVCLLL